MTQIILRQDGQEKIIQIDKDVFSVGRANNNDIPIPKDGISRVHCEIKRKDDIYLIVDNNSLNGTFLNGVRITEEKLVPGDQIKVGDALIIFEKEIKKSDEPKHGHKARQNNFISPTRKNNAGLFFAIAAVFIAISVIVFWRVSVSEKERAITNNLLGINSSFEKQISGWKILPELGVRFALTGKEKHMGGQSLEIKNDSAEQYAEFSYSKILIDSDAAAVTFGGWVKSDSFNKSVVGFKLEWFKEGEKNAFWESNTDFIEPRDQWNNIMATIQTPAGFYNNRNQVFAVKFSCIISGKGSKIYIDDVVISPAKKENSEGLIFNDIKDIRLAGYAGGDWALLRNNEVVLFDGCITVKKQGETAPCISSGGEGDKYSSRRIFYPDTGEWLNYQADFKSDNESILLKYLIPVQKLSFDISEAYIKYRIPKSIITGPYKIKGSIIKEFMLHESVKEKDVAEIDFPLDNVVLVIKFPGKSDLVIDRSAGDLEIRHGFFSKETLNRNLNDTLIFDVVFGIKPLVKESSVTINQIMEKVKELEMQEQFGEAIRLYRKVMANTEKNSKLWIEADKSLKVILGNAEAAFGEIDDLAKATEVLGDEESFSKTESLAMNFLNAYKNSEFEEKAAELLSKARKAYADNKTENNKSEAGILRNMAQGYFNEGKWFLAKMFLDKIINILPGSEEAKKAGEMLEIVNEKIKEKNKQE